MHDNLGNFVNILNKCIHNTSGVLVRHRFEPMQAFGSVNVIELEVFDMPDILVVGLVHDEWQLIVSAGNRNDECRLVDVFDIILGSIKFVRRVHRL